VEAASVSDAWRQAMRALFARTGRRAIHTVVSIAAPVAEQDATWSGLDGWLAQHGFNSIETVANTIFPAHLAATSRDHAHLVDRYRRMYPVLRRRFPANRAGTYFGRLVAYPSADGEFDQLGAVVERIRRERTGGHAKQARYEAALQHPDDLTEDATATAIYMPGRDNSAMGFPCLSHCSFQLDSEGHVHLLAHYRSQFMVKRAYGNYVGLGRLLAYVAGGAGLWTGKLTVVAGLAQIEPPTLGLRKLVAD
jgi:thymidylate synthase